MAPPKNNLSPLLILFRALPVREAVIKLSTQPNIHSPGKKISKFRLPRVCRGNSVKQSIECGAVIGCEKLFKLGLRIVMEIECSTCHGPVIIHELLYQPPRADEHRRSESMWEVGFGLTSD